MPCKDNKTRKAAKSICVNIVPILQGIDDNNVRKGNKLVPWMDMIKYFELEMINPSIKVQRRAIGEQY
jgi:hypothetical protein